MPILSEYARKKKVAFFFRDVPKESRIFEIGCGDGWLGTWLKSHGWPNYTGLDIFPPADIVGNIADWRRIGIQPESFDVVVAFEVVEHIDCFQEMHDILKPGGLLMLTSPLPNMDWVCQLFERIGLSQRRTSPHDHLVAFDKIPLFDSVDLKTVGFLAQWGVFRRA